MLTPPCVSPMPQPVTSAFRTSALSSPSVSLRKSVSRAVLHDHAAAVEGDRRRNAELLGEDGELVGPAVAVGVFADADAVAALARRLQFVRIVERLADPEPAALVPGHADRLAAELAARLTNSSHLEAVGRDEVLQRLLGAKRLLHLASTRRPRPACRRAGRTAILASLILERLDVRALRRHLRRNRVGTPSAAIACQRTPARRSDRRRPPSGCRARRGS